MTTWLTWYDAGSSYLRFILDEPCEGGELSIDSGRMGGAREVVVAVNQRPLGFVPQTGPPDSKLDISAALGDLWGDVTVELRPVDLDSANPIPILGLQFD